jgi:hypothetical protein
MDVQNVSASWLQEELVLGVMLRFDAEFSVAQYLEVDKPVAQTGERNAEEQRQPEQPLKL